MSLDELSGWQKRCKLTFGGNVTLGDEVHKLELEGMPPVARKRTTCMPIMSTGCCLLNDSETKTKLDPLAMSCRLPVALIPC